MFGDEVAELDHEVSAVSWGEVAPGGVFEGFSGGGNSSVDIVDAGGVDGGDLGFITVGN